MREWKCGAGRIGYTWADAMSKVAPGRSGLPVLGAAGALRLANWYN